MPASSQVGQDGAVTVFPLSSGLMWRYDEYGRLDTKASQAVSSALC